MEEITIKEMKKIELDILNKITQICRENNITYSLIGGSAIGIIRHKGIIPWDDDIDIMMLREDYNKLKEIFLNNDNCIDDFKFMDVETQEDYNYSFGKIVSLKTTAKEKGIKKIQDYGVFVDIFPLDKVPSENFIRKMYFLYIMLRLKLGILLLYEKNISKSKLTLIIKNIVKSALFWVNPHRFALKTNKIIQKFNDKEYDDYCMTCDYVSCRKKIIKNKKYYQSVVELPFEDTTSFVISEYDQYLKAYFNNYMELPPIENRISEHNWEYIRKC